LILGEFKLCTSAFWGTFWAFSFLCMQVHAVPNSINDLDGGNDSRVPGNLSMGANAANDSTMSWLAPLSASLKPGGVSDL
jgi:hypothetical protein